MSATWRTFLGTVTRPRATFVALADDLHPGRQGAHVLAVVCAVYTAILGVFIVRGYPAAAPSVLGLSTERQYLVQIWYQVPLFFASTAVTAAVVVALARFTRCRVAFGVAFGRVALATAVPFALTTMLVESVLAALIAFGVLQPLPTLQWLLGPGAWFAALYQLAGLVWLVALVVTALRASGFTGWTSILAAVPVIVVYGLPVALLIR